MNETFLVVFDFHFDQQQRVERIERCDGYELLDVDPLELTAERSHLALAPRQPQEHEEYRREGREQGVSEHDAMRHDSRHAGEAEAFEGAGEELEDEEQGEQPAQAGGGATQSSSPEATARPCGPSRAYSRMGGLMIRPT